MNDTISQMRQEVAWGCSLADRAGERREAMNKEIVPGFDIEQTEGLSISLERIEGGADLLGLKLAGQIDIINTIGFQKRVDRAVRAGYRWLIFDLGGVHYISSTGVGAFTSLLRTLRQRQGDLALVGTRPNVMQIITLLGLSSFFTFAGSRGESLECFAQQRAAAPPAFPRVFSCPVCGKRLRGQKAGRYRCPECKTVLALDASGSAVSG
jgi:anti-anti-sigma factor